MGRATDRNEQMYREVTDRILADLKAGVMPWRKAWDDGGPIGMPSNAVTGREYSGSNVLVLWSEALDKGYATSEWCTFKQAMTKLGYERDGRFWNWKGGGEDPKHGVRKGEKGTPVYYFEKKVFTPKATDQESEPEEKGYMMARRFIVFNVDQIEGWPETEPREPRSEFEANEAAEEFIRNVGADVRHGGGQPKYSPSADYIRLPEPERFDTTVEYYATSLHEHGHWTGHKDRLDRFGETSKTAYAFEELIAEMCAAFTCATLGVQGKTQESEYIGHWIELLEDNSKVVVRAASQAAKAHRFLADLQPAKQEVAA